MLDVLAMLAILGEVALAISTAAALHRFECRPDFGSLSNSWRSPLVLAVLVVAQAVGGGFSLKKVHGLFACAVGRKSHREFRLELRQPNHAVAVEHEVMARTKVRIELLAQVFAID